MKPKILLLVLVLMFASKSASADFPLACGSYDSCATAVTCSTSTGIFIAPNYSSLTPTVNVAHITSVDSMTIRLSISGCFISRIDSVSVNGEAVGYVISHQPFSYWIIRMLSMPGDYFIHGWNSSVYPVGVTFKLVLDPVGIKETQENEASVSVFPNPATNELTVLSKNTPLKSLRIFNSSGQEKERFNVAGNELKIPLSNYPPGIYFIHVATLNDKISIKKITVL